MVIKIAATILGFGVFHLVAAVLMWALFRFEVKE